MEYHEKWSFFNFGTIRKELGVRTLLTNYTGFYKITLLDLDRISRHSDLILMKFCRMIDTIAE